MCTVPQGILVPPQILSTREKKEQNEKGRNIKKEKQKDSKGTKKIKRKNKKKGKTRKEIEKENENEKQWKIVKRKKEGPVVFNRKLEIERNRKWKQSAFASFSGEET